MGVPTFYRWLSAKYPKVVRDAIEERCALERASQTFVPVDLNGPNPNEIEFDNLYIDMNGVVHPCAHPEEGTQPSTESEMFQNVCDYIDRIVGIARPRKLLYLCLDGVAPRAKMNQQRSRRYKAAHEAERSQALWKEISDTWVANGKTPPPMKVHWDSNVITPGTDFMDRLAFMLRFYVAQRMAESSYWRNLIVLVSDSNVAGEGEHKVMAYVREMRGLCDPNTVHCIHGMDADLIMLGLSTHEAHFYIMREAIVERNSSPTNQPNHQQEPQTGGIKSNACFRAGWKPMQFLQLPVLREYLAAEFKFAPEQLIVQNSRTGQIYQLDSQLERHIDDFIFMCFFVGNDFLPHLPSLSLQKGSIDMMMLLYKHKFAAIGGYLTAGDGTINVDAVIRFTEFLSKAEPAIFKDEVIKKQQDERRAAQSLGDSARQTELPFTPESRKRSHGQVELSSSVNIASKTDSQAHLWSRGNRIGANPSVSGRIVVDDIGSDVVRPFPDSTSNTDPPSVMSVMPDPVEVDDEEFGKEMKKQLSLKIKEISDLQANQQVNLGEGQFEEYRSRYYQTKFGIGESEVESIAAKVAHNYVRGLQWVLLYYRRGVPSWSWYFPHHYAPLAYDIHKYGFNKLDRASHLSPFTLGAPVKPIEQLMSVLPPRSASFIPKAYRELMLSPSSALKDFYPAKFHEDSDGKKFAWQWVAILPFIDIERLLYWTSKVEHTLTETESRRNRCGFEYLFMAPEHPLRSAVTDGMFRDARMCGISHLLSPDDERYPLPMDKHSGLCKINEEGFKAFKIHCDVFTYERPKELSDLHGQPIILPGVSMPAPQLTESDLYKEDPQHRGRGPFNINVARRIILTVIGGKVYQEYLEREAENRAKQDAARMNPANMIDIRNMKVPRVQNISNNQHHHRHNNTYSQNRSQR